MVEKPLRVIVAGSGPAGMMAAIRAAQLHRSVMLVEQKAQPGAKLLLTGKGRCNLTNSCSLEEFLKRFSSNGAFLRDAFKLFFVKDLMRFFEERGVALKVERQQRVFPKSDRSASILQCLRKELDASGVRLYLRSRVSEVLVEGGAAVGVLLDGGTLLTADKVILATGGASYAFSGSDGSGLKLAAKLGHRLVDLRPGLVPLLAAQPYVKKLEGLTLKNISLTFTCGAGKLVSEVGELVFTASGVSGPLVLTHSGQVVDWLRQVPSVRLGIDLKPALSVEQLDQRLQRDFKSFPRTALRNLLKEYLPQRLVDCFIMLSNINPALQANQVSQPQRRKLVSLLKDFPLDIKASLPLEEAMVTRGGVSLKDIDPRTMQSRLVKNLYFCGEMIDVDADTGGFNLQAAFSTGYLAGETR